MFALVLLALLTVPAAAGANPLGDLFRISELAPNDGHGSAFDTQVAYNGGTSEYLVSWTADGYASPGEDEVWVQRVSNAGAQIGADRRISTIGAEGDGTREPFGRPAVAADPVNDRNLVVWSADPENNTFGNSEFRIYGQLLAADGSEIGVNDFAISGSQAGALYPHVAFNPEREEYLVVWSGNATGTPVQWGRRLDKNGAPIAAPFQISQLAESGRGSLPQVAYNASKDEYLVAWYGFKGFEDGEAWGQRINAVTGAAIGGDVKLTTHGAVEDDIAGGFPSISYNPLAGDYLMTYTKDDDNPNPDTLEVQSQVLSATAVPQGSPVRLSTVGKLAYEPATAYATGPGGGAGQYLVVWQQESPPPGFYDYEIWGQRVRYDGVLLGTAFKIFEASESFNIGPWVARRTDAIEWLTVWTSDCPHGAGIPAQDNEILGRRVGTAAAATGDGVCKLPGVDPDPTPTPTPGGTSPPGSQPPTALPAPPAAPKPTSRLKPADVLRLPSTRRCVSRRRFRIRLRTPRGAKLAKLTVRLNGKLVRTVRGKRITARVDLRGLPRGRFRVTIEVRTVDGRKVTATRRYRTCAPKRRG
jgi:hypothetical protein